MARSLVLHLPRPAGRARPSLVDTDDTVVEHAQLTLPEGGGVMPGSANRPGNIWSFGSYGGEPA